MNGSKDLFRFAAVLLAAAGASSAGGLPAVGGALDDPREVVRLAPAEAEKLRAGMRAYVESLQGIVAALAANRTADVPELAARSGARMLRDVSLLSGLQLPPGFVAMSLATHSQFDELAETAARGTSRTAILESLSGIMANCVSCHAAYRLAR